MQRRTLGRTGLEVSPVAFGTAPLGQLFGPVPLEDGVRAVRTAIDLGVNLFDASPYYGDAEERLGIALDGVRDEVLVSSKAGRYLGAGRFTGEVFDFSPARIRSSLENTLRLLRTDHLDILLLHDVDFVDINGILGESIPALLQLKQEGLVRAVGASGYGLGAMTQITQEEGVDVVLSFAHGTLLENTLGDVLAPAAATNEVGLLNAAAVALGALTPAVETRDDDTFLAPPSVLKAARAMLREATDRGADISHLANQYAIQRTGAVTTVIGTTKIAHLQDAVAAADEPIDEELLAAVLAHRPDPATHQWDIGLPENR